jgi:uncharacterized protein
VSNRIFIDTLFVIALINRRDQYHQQALDLAEQFEGHPLLVTDAVLLVQNQATFFGMTRCASRSQS